MPLFGHSVDKYVTGRMLQTSNAKGWSNLLAERWSHAPGELPSLTPRDTEIAVLLSGRSLVDRMGAGMRQRMRARRGTVWLCPAGIEEEFIDIAEPVEDCLHLFLPARPFSEMMLRDLDIDPARMELRYESVEYDPFIESVALRIADELDEESAAGRLLVESLGGALAAHLVQRYSARTLRPEVRQPLDKPLHRARLSRVIEFVEVHLDEDFTVADLASVACMSTSHFSRGFRAATGMTPHGFVSGRRLERVRERLVADDRPIAEIAIAAGFSSQANFTRAFRKATGVTPAQFRARMRTKAGEAARRLLG